MIGIVGGMGSFAGLFLHRQILDNTKKGPDQSYIPIAHLAFPDLPDRTEFLRGKAAHNPAIDIAGTILQLDKLGASVVGIACNTAHAKPILSVVENILRKAECKIEIVNMIEQAANYLADQGIKRVGILSTEGTFHSNVYHHELETKKIELLNPTPDIVEKVHQAIYNKRYGIKENPDDLERAQEEIKEVISRYFQDFQETPPEKIILGCTEFTLIRDELEGHFGKEFFLDASSVLARALIQKAYPNKLKEL